MKYIVYQTTNLINDKIYIGVHQTENPDKFDSYLGCGCYTTRPSTYKNPKTAFQYAVNKYGVKNFKRIVLYVYDTAKEAYNKEAQIVDEAFVTQSTNYNMALGGFGGNVAQKVYQFNKQGVLLNTWACTVELAEAWGASINSVYTAIQYKEGFRGTFLSFNETINIEDFAKSNDPIIVYCYNTDGKLLKSFDTETEASKELNIKRTDISIAIKYQQLIENKYYFSTTLYDTYIKKARKSLRGCKFYLYNQTGEFECEFRNAEELQAFFKLKSWAVLSKKINYENGYYKQYRILTSKVDSVEPFTEQKQNKPVLVYNSTGEFVGEYESERKAAKDLDCKMGQINRVLRNVAKSHKGYVFKWKVNDIV